MKMGKTGAGFRKCAWVCPILFFILFIGGCHPTLRKEVVRPEEALVRVRFFYPEFRDDMDLSSLESAVNHSLTYLSRQSPDRIFEYGKDKYSYRHVIESQKELLSLIRTCESRSSAGRSGRISSSTRQKVVQRTQQFCSPAIMNPRTKPAFILIIYTNIRSTRDRTISCRSIFLLSGMSLRGRTSSQG